MALLQWNDDFATGVPAADHEHDKMIGLINSVHGRWLKKGNGNWPALCDEVLNILFDHFRFEDQIMHGTAYAGQEAHAHDHDRIVKELRRIRARADEPRFDMASALASCLQRWLVEHIRHHDAPLYRSLAPAS